MLWLLQIVIGAKWNAEKTVFENHTLKQANEEMFRKHENSNAAMGISNSPLFFAVLEELAPSLRDSYVIWLFLNFDSMMLSGNLLASRLPLLIAPTFRPGVLDRLPR